MSSINSKVVYRTVEILETEQKNKLQKVSYNEYLLLNKWYNPIPFISLLVFLTSMMTLGPNKWFRNLIKKIMPPPGEGPSDKQIEQGFFHLTAIGSNQSDEQQTVILSYPGDPGNKSTVFFLCESALLLASGYSLKRSGFLTPIGAFEGDLCNHLKEKGLTVTN